MQFKRGNFHAISEGLGPDSMQFQRFECSGQKWKKLLVCDDILYSGVFGVADYESRLKIKKFEIADLMWQTKMQNSLDWDDILYAGFLGSMLKIRKFIRADPIWQTKKLIN